MTASDFNYLSSGSQSPEDMTERIKELEIRLLAARDHARGISAELGEMRYRVEVAQQEAKKLRKQLEQIKNSKTWKIGSFVLLPVRLIRKILG
jgi:uncharacterized coiled-coil protein SlyX